MSRNPYQDKNTVEREGDVHRESKINQLIGRYHTACTVPPIACGQPDLRDTAPASRDDPLCSGPCVPVHLQRPPDKPAAASCFPTAPVQHHF